MGNFKNPRRAQPGLFFFFFFFNFGLELGNVCACSVNKSHFYCLRLVDFVVPWLPWPTKIALNYSIFEIQGHLLDLDVRQCMTTYDFV